MARRDRLDRCPRRKLKVFDESIDTASVQSVHQVRAGLRGGGELIRRTWLLRHLACTHFLGSEARQPKGKEGFRAHFIGLMPRASFSVLRVDP